MKEAVRNELLTPEVLRVGINKGNVLLVTGESNKGVPKGVAPDMGRAFADRIGVNVQYVTFATPGEVADAAEHNQWDLGLIAREPKREEVIAFCDPYVEIEATYLVPDDSPFRSIEDVDAPDVRIAVSNRAAYDLYLSRTLKHAMLCRAEGLEKAFKLFAGEKLDALAGLVPALRENVKMIPGFRLIPGRYTVVQQAIGTRHGKLALNAEVQAFLADAKKNGLIAKLIEKHGVAGKLKVAV